MRKQTIFSRRKFLQHTTATAVAISTLWGCGGPNLVAPGDLTELSAGDAIAAMVAQRQKARDAIRTHFEKENIVALAFPPAMIPAHRIEDNGSMTVRGERVPNTTTVGRNVSLSSFVSMARLVLPAGLTTSGLPVGLKFDALPGTDRKLLGLGVSIQRALGSIPAPQV